MSPSWQSSWQCTYVSRHTQGVENVYAQHVPLLMTTIEAALKAKLKDNTYPSVGQTGGKPQEVSDVNRAMMSRYRTALMRVLPCAMV